MQSCMCEYTGKYILLVDAWLLAHVYYTTMTGTEVSMYVILKMHRFRVSFKATVHELSTS